MTCLDYLVIDSVAKTYSHSVAELLNIQQLPTCNFGRFRSSNNSLGTEVSPELQYTAAELQEPHSYINMPKIKISQPKNASLK